MNRKDLLSFLLIEFLAALLAVVSFSQISERFVAGMVAGSGFLFLGAWIVIRTWRWSDKWVALSFWAGHIHLWLISLPMVLSRLANRETSFEQTAIWGLEGPQFHRVSEIFYLILVAATIIDLVRLRFRKNFKKAAQR